MDVRMALVTTASKEAAIALAERLVEERLAACGTVVDGVTSVFRWEGAVQTETEALLVLKTGADSVDALVRRVPELHEYDVPEVLVLDVGAGHAPYLEWVVSNTGGGT